MQQEAGSAPHAVSRLRSQRLLRSTRPFLARGGPKGERCGGCRLLPSHCLCAHRPVQATRAGVCLIMHEHEALKPSNTGWLIADVVPDTMAFEWSRTAPDAAMLAALQDPQWQPYLVFPGEFVEPSRVISALPPAEVQQSGSKRPLFILLDATWSEARKIFKKSPYLAQMPVLSLQPEQVSRYALRRSRRDDHLCTAEVAALCLQQSGDTEAAAALELWFDAFSDHYLRAKQQLPADWNDALHQQLCALKARVTQAEAGLPD